MAESDIVDLDSMLADLRLAVRYASRVGLLRDKAVLATIEKIEGAFRQTQKPDIVDATTALNDVASLIAPMTLADLRAGRDPFDDDNQTRSRYIQLGLTLFSLIVLVTIGYFMHALSREQEALKALETIQELKPQQRLTELRRIAQWDDPLALPRTPRTLNDQYHQKVTELMQINSQVVSTYTAAVMASQIPLFPLQEIFSSAPIAYGSPPPVATPSPLKLQQPTAAQLDSSSGVSGPALGSKSAYPPSAQPPSSEAGKGESYTAADICAEDAIGELRLPTESTSYPKWMKSALRDSLNDFCFQLKVVSPGGGGALLSQSLYQLEFADAIKQKVSLRVAWFLPFLYGLLGSAIFVMRNVASVRTPSVDWFPITMRISLGGVAGIVVGWFAAGSTSMQTTSLLSLPFALAFLTGYGIDVLFTLLDRFNRALGETQTKAAT